MHNYPNITNRKIRVALIGCGRIANNHFDAIEGHAENVELVDVCDVNADSLSQAVARTKATGHTNLTTLLEKNHRRPCDFDDTQWSAPRTNHSSRSDRPPHHDRETHGHSLA